MKPEDTESVGAEAQGEIEAAQAMQQAQQQAQFGSRLPALDTEMPQPFIFEDQRSNYDPDMDARVSQLEEQMALVTPPAEDCPKPDDMEDSEGVHHPWRVITKVVSSTSYWAMTNGDANAAHAGSIYNPKGKSDAYINVDKAWTVYDPTAGQSAWLVVSVDVASMSITSASVVTTDPGNADPYNPTTAVFVWELFTIQIDGTIKQYLTSDLTLEGNLFFKDTSYPEDVKPSNAVGTDKYPARRDHQHKLDLTKAGSWDAIPTPADIMPSGGTPDNKSAGVAAYPARSDHVHDLDLASAGFDGITASRTVTGPPTRPDDAHLSFPQYAMVFTKGLLTSVTTIDPVVLESKQC